MKKLFCLLVLFLCIQLSYSAAQTQDTTVAPIDTTIKIDISQPKEKSPKRAAFLSLALPGTGQVYNGRWWKVPIVYGAIGGMVYLIDYNTGLYNRLQTALTAERNGETHEFTGTTIGNLNSLVALRDGFDKDRQLSYIGLVFVYALQSMEAFVDGHLQQFDVSDDLSLKIKPSIETIQLSGSQAVLGVGIQLNFGDQKRDEQILRSISAQ
ncbi:MAG: DUF5683 domain-containing protein [Saprospiraceae bacterium]|nr:DUF5683 domain-containing protein [Saprospiraceae bacterium]